MTDKSRTLPKSLASIVEMLELEQPRIVTLKMIGGLALTLGQGEKDLADLRRIAYRLESLGWLGSLRTRGAWEFLPGARAGAYGAYDRLIEFKAQKEVNPQWSGVLSMESAAAVLGLAQRLPKHESVALPRGHVLPKAMSEWRRVSIVLPKSGLTIIDSMPVWSLEGLLAGVALRPSAYYDLIGLAQWLPETGSSINVGPLIDCLKDAPS